MKLKKKPLAAKTSRGGKRAPASGGDGSYTAASIEVSKALNRSPTPRHVYRRHG